MKSLKITVAIALAALFMAPVFNGCKKGEEDPGISLKSRKGRLVGEWNLTEGKVVSSDASGVETETYNNGSYTYTTTGGSAVSQYTWDITFEKTGTYALSQTYTYTGGMTTVTTEGMWYFANGSKESEYKDKEVLFLQVTSTTTSSSGSSSVNTYSGGDLSALEIVRLSSKELKAYSKYTHTSLSGTFTQESEFTYEKNK